MMKANVPGGAEIHLLCFLDSTRLTHLPDQRAPVDAGKRVQHNECAAPQH
jgi:hypothetical protein